MSSGHEIRREQGGGMSAKKKIREALELLGRCVDAKAADDALSGFDSIERAIAESLAIMRAALIHADYPEDCMWQVREKLESIAKEEE
jgi:hypothetical protein